MPEVIVEAGYSFDRSRGNLCDFADPLKGLPGQVAVIALDGVQYPQHVLMPGADFFDGSIYECQIQLFHQLLLPIQYKFLTPRIYIRPSAKAGEA
jgi:hypothetical protein